MNKLLGATALAVLLGATAAIAQTTTPASPPASAPVEKMTPPAASTTTVTKDLALTEVQANGWIKKAVFSSDGKNVGEVIALKRDASGRVSELQAGIGGFIGIGETQVRVMPAQFKFENDRVVLSLTSEQVKALPKLAK